MLELRYAKKNCSLFNWNNYVKILFNINIFNHNICVLVLFFGLFICCSRGMFYKSTWFCWIWASIHGCCSACRCCSSIKFIKYSLFDSNSLLYCCTLNFPYYSCNVPGLMYDELIIFFVLLQRSLFTHDPKSMSRKENRQQIRCADS